MVRLASSVRSPAPTPAPGRHARELRPAGTPLRHWLHGRPDAPLVACTHGVPLDHRTFAGQVPALAAAGHRALARDVRGHGASRPLGSRIRIRDVADDLLALLDAAHAEQAVVAGQSSSGMVVQDLLARHPERVAGMGVIGAPPLGERPGPGMRMLQRLRVASTRVWPDRNLRWALATMITRDPQVRLRGRGHPRAAQGRLRRRV